MAEKRQTPTPTPKPSEKGGYRDSEKKSENTVSFDRPIPPEKPKR